MRVERHEEISGREHHLKDLRVSHNGLHDQRKVPEDLRHGMLGDHQEIGISIEVKEIGNMIKNRLCLVTVDRIFAEIGQKLMYQLRREGDQTQVPMYRHQPMYRLQKIGDQELNQKIERMELNQKEERMNFDGRHMI